MPKSIQSSRRDRRGRFVKGASGNPAGRPPGIMNAATRIAALLLSEEAGPLTRKAIDLALAGDLAALRLCLDRIIAPQREQPIAFNMPAIASPADLVTAMTELSGAAAAGMMTPAEAASLSRALEAQARVIETTARVEAERLAARQAEVAARLDLRVCVVMAHHLQDFQRAGEADYGIRERLAEMLRLGKDARLKLATIPDTPELVEADGEFLAAHPLPLDRVSHPIGAGMRAAWDEFDDYWQRPTTQERLDQYLGEHASNSTNATISPDPDLIDQVQRKQ